MDLTDKIYADASRLPLKDAAFTLWIHRLQLDRSESPPRAKRASSLDLSVPEVFARTARDAIATVRHQYATAHDGPTFHRLKKAHPEANDGELKEAIKAAVKLDQDCTRFYGNVRDERQAVDLAKAENPDFQEETYSAAYFELCRAMR